MSPSFLQGIYVIEQRIKRKREKRDLNFLAERTFACGPAFVSPSSSTYPEKNEGPLVTV